MVVYRNKPSTALRWVIAIIVFGLAMTITFAEADGATLINNLF